MKYLFVLIVVAVVFSCSHSKQAGKPWDNKIQQIPGRIECEFYDQGGEGVAYHDSDSINNGSGKLNPANGAYLNEFRMREAVDISYTKGNSVDNNPFNQSEPLLNQLYVGWTQPGEWINYTVRVNESGRYIISTKYTANGDGAIVLDVDGNDISGKLVIPSTHDDRDTIAWRQWHHWSTVDSLVQINLSKGIHRFTVHIAAHGNMNFDYFDFRKGRE